MRWGGKILLAFPALAVAGYLYFHDSSFLWVALLPILALISLSFLLFAHEAGHLFFGILLRFPVIGIEIGEFPFRTIRMERFQLRIGRLPWRGRTVLGVSPRTFSPARRFFFIAGGIFFEGIFLGAACFLARKIVALEVLWVFLLMDQIWVNLLPRKEGGEPANDGALLTELFFPQKIRPGSIRSIF